MLLDFNECIDQQEEIEFFNNIGRQGEIEGRLTVKLTVNPSPRIEWEFESATSNALLQDPFTEASVELTSREQDDSRLRVVNPEITNLRNKAGLPLRNSGNALQVLYGDAHAPAHRFEFYLANAYFMHRSQRGTLTQTIQERGGRTRHRNQAGRAFQAGTEQGWAIDVETSQQALDWLEPKRQNRGSMVTTSGLLYQPQVDVSQSHQLPSNTQAKSLLEVRNVLVDLGWLISFANAGHLGPLYIKAEQYTGRRETPIEPVAAVALAYTTTPLEAVGISWVTHSSNLQTFIECFPAFQRMLSNPAWRDKWMMILEWYFQAIPPRPWGRKKTWFTMANALGTLLEHLARLILVDDEMDTIQRQTHEKLFKLGKSKERLEYLLERVGIINEKAWIGDFLAVRNDATHAIVKNEITPSRREEVIRHAIQWVDEVLLWRIGYADDYLDRIADYAIEPRYDLSRRNSDW